MASGKQAGYMLTLSVYTGLECNELLQCNAVLDSSASITTKTVMELLESGIFLTCTDKYGLTTGSIQLNFY